MLLKHSQSIFIATDHNNLSIIIWIASYKVDKLINLHKGLMVYQSFHC